MGALPSAEADSACSTLSFPALTCRAITCRASRLEFGGSYSTALPGIRFPRILLRAGLSHSAPFGAGAALPFRQCTQCPADYRANISCTCALNFGYSGSFCNSGIGSPMSMAASWRSKEVCRQVRASCRWPRAA